MADYEHAPKNVPLDRPHGFVQQWADGAWQWICGWCGAAATVQGRQPARHGLEGHLLAEHEIAPPSPAARVAAPERRQKVRA